MKSSRLNNEPGRERNPRGERPLTGNSGRQRVHKALYSYHRGDYCEALSDFEKACEFAARASDHHTFIEACIYILRILAEREESSRTARIENHILTILSAAEISGALKSRAMYVLGICCCYQKNRHDQAMDHFRLAVDCAIASGDKEAIAGPLYGAATILYARQRYDEALKELSRLEVLLSCLRVPDLVSASQLLRAMILRDQKRPDEALEAGWAAYDSLKHHPHLPLYLHTLCVLGTIFHLKGDTASARLYLDLADRGLKREQFPRVARLVDDALRDIGGPRPSDVDLVYNTQTGVLIERNKGVIRFDGQFILRDLLRVFLENPGRIFTKEELAARVWRQIYDPGTHDNKIYVTVKRLRKLLETEGAASDYILRAKAGYLLNPKTRIVVNDCQVNDRWT